MPTTEQGRIARRLVECSPLHSNYFAYSRGEKGSGIDLYYVGRATAGSEIGRVGGRGSITDRPLPDAFLSQVTSNVNRLPAWRFLRLLLCRSRSWSINS